MIKKLLTRLLVLGTAALLGWFVFLSVESPGLRVEKSDPEPSESPMQMGRGKAARYQKYDGQGNLITTGESQRTTQTGERDFVLEDVSITHKANNRQFSIKAHHVVTEEGGRRVMTADPADPASRVVLVEEDGIRLATRGPLIQENDGTVSTDAATDFTMDASKGACVGLRYRAGEFLEMKSRVLLTTVNADAETRVEADYLLIDDQNRWGEIRRGVIATSDETRRTLLLANTIDVAFRGNMASGGMAMDQAILSGEPSTFVWANGDLQAASVDICFDASGRWAQELTTAPDAVFSSQTDDNYWVTGRGGSLHLLLESSNPHLLTAKDPVNISGMRGNDPELRLLGKEGMETEFLDGVVSSTRIFGRPEFSYGSMSGKAGSLRVVHNQHQVLFNGGAELVDAQSKVRIKGDEVLLTNWDRSGREVYAFKFVEILYGLEDGTQVRGSGNKLEMELPREYVKLEGEPAKFERPGETIEANVIEVSDIDGDIFNLATDSQVLLTKTLPDGDLRVEAMKMQYTGAKRTLHFEKVLQAVMPNQGELSCDQLDIMMKRGRGKDAVEKVVAYRNVVFKHTMVKNGEVKKVSALADKMTLDPETQIVELLGEDRDIVVNTDGSMKVRRLIYNLKNANFEGFPVKQGRNKTTIPIKNKP